MLRLETSLTALVDMLFPAIASGAGGAAAGLTAWIAARRFSGDRAPAPWVLGAAGAIAGLWALGAGTSGWALASSLVLAAGLLALTAVDAAEHRLPDLLTAQLVLAGLVAALAISGGRLVDHVAGAVAGYVAFAAIAWVYRRWRGRDGLGLGDAKLMAAAGAWLGWAPLASVVLVGCLIALAWVGVRAMRLGRRTLTDRLPFGPALCAAIWIVWLYGPLAPVS